MKKNQAIGVFDSGLGGLTVVKEILKALPYENIIYFGDTARVPYGNKSKKTITKFSIENVNFLKKFNVKIIIVACNTSCSLSINTLKKKYKIPIVGVISPAVKKALNLSKNLRLGIIGTRSTIKSNVYPRGLKILNKNVKVFSRSCPLFVPLVEEDWINEKVTLDIAKKYLLPLKAKDIDTLILACTHYPLLTDIISKIMTKKVRLINSAKEVAQEVKRVLMRKHYLETKKRTPICRFYVSDEPEQFVKLGQRFLGRRIERIRKA